MSGEKAHVCSKEFSKNTRKNIVKMINKANSGHPGGSLSCTDILAVLYTKVLNIDPANPDWEERDRLILSKGHSAPALYATLAGCGYCSEEELLTFDQINSRFQGHPDMTATPGVDMSSGSLGQRLSVGLGMALAAKRLQKNLNVWVIVGDGELQEGQIWEAAMSAFRYSLDNLNLIIDYNNLQLVGEVDKTLPVEPLSDKWKAFGWHVLEIDGHDHDQILQATRYASAHKGGPTVIIAKTTKGKGVSFMEDNYIWHSKGISDEELNQALSEINQDGEEL